MGLKPRYKDKDLQEAFLIRKEKLYELIKLNLSVLAVKAVNHARENRGYTDQTGNLVNSTGFILLRDGVNVYEDFRETYNANSKKNKGKKKKEFKVYGPVPIHQNGQAEGKNLANEIASDFANFQGWALIVVAGMEYATTVEYEYGKNVLAATELFIRQEMPKTIEKIKNAAKRIKV